MGTAKKTRKFGAVSSLPLPLHHPPKLTPPPFHQVKRIIGQNDARLKKNANKAEEASKAAEKAKGTEIVREVPQMSSALFFQYNTALVPPYSVLVDTNFLSHTVQRKLPLLETLMDTFYGVCFLFCGSRDALRPNFFRLPYALFSLGLWVGNMH